MGYNAMSIPKYNIEIRKYCKWTLVLSEISLTLTDYGAIMQIRSKDNTEIIELSTADDNGRIVIDVVNSTITLTILSAETALFEYREGRYDLLLIDPDGEYIPFLEGAVNIIEGVTIPATVI